MTDHKVTNRGLRESAKTVGDGLATKRHRQSDEQTTGEKATHNGRSRARKEATHKRTKVCCDVRFQRRHVQKEGDEHGEGAELCERDVWMQRQGQGHVLLNVNKRKDTDE